MRLAMGLTGTAVLAICTIASAADPRVVLDETRDLRCYYRFATDLVSPAAFKAEGEKTLGAAGFDRLSRETQRALDRAENDGFAVFRPSALMLKQARRVGTIEAMRNPGPAASADWRDHVFLRMFFDPFTAPPPPTDWAAPTFDDSGWVLGRPFQVDMPNDLPADKTTGNMAKVHVEALQFIGTGLHAACYRGRFVVDDPAQAGELTLRLVYRGGIRALVNGQEIARGHLPAGELSAEAAGDDYPADAYRDGAQRDRVLGPVKVPASLLVKGANVLAVEVRASNLHPVVLKKVQSRSWNALHDREGLWRHGFLARLDLRAGGAGVSGPGRPAGVQLWAADIHRRVCSTDFRPPGETPGTVRIVGAQNGTFAGQLIVGTDKSLTGLRVSVGELKQTDGSGLLPASAVKVFGMLPFPADEFNQKLGDERGLDAKFPPMPLLAQYQRIGDARRPCVFDQISPAIPTSVAAGTCQPVWLSLRIPADAPPGKYRGAVRVEADGVEAVSVPLEVEVVGWRLPDPRAFQTFVACEQNPYGVAKQYGVKLWSEEHFKLVESSLRQLSRIGNTWLNVPILRASEFGNRDDSMVRWIRRADGSLAFDYAVLDRYLELAVRHMGASRAIQFVVMHGMLGGIKPAPPPEVNVLDQRTGRTEPMALSLSGASKAASEKAWTAFALSLRDHLRAKGLDKAMCWGHPLDREEDPDLRALLTKVTPGVNWAAGPHQIGWQGFSDPHYRFLGTVRYFNNWPGFRMDMGWKAPLVHLTIPRIDSSVQSLHTASHPFGFRTLVNHSLALGRAGFCRVGADEWAAVHYDGMRVPVWIVGMPVLFVLWPGRDGADSSARFEALLEGVQEGEARIFLEQALDRRQVSGPLAGRVRQVLSDHYQETCFFQNKLCIFELEKYHHRWQERSRELFQAAAAVARASGGAAP